MGIAKSIMPEAFPVCTFTQFDRAQTPCWGISPVNCLSSPLRGIKSKDLTSQCTCTFARCFSTGLGRCFEWSGGGGEILAALLLLPGSGADLMWWQSCWKRNAVAWGASQMYVRLISDCRRCADGTAHTEEHVRNFHTWFVPQNYNGTQDHRGWEHMKASLHLGPTVDVILSCVFSSTLIVQSIFPANFLFHIVFPLCFSLQNSSHIPSEHFCFQVVCNPKPSWPASLCASYRL